MAKPGFIVFDTDAIYNVDDLSDVVITSVADDEMLAYDSGTSKWINQTASEIGLDAAYINVTGDAMTGTLTTVGRIVNTTRQTTTYTALVTDDSIFCDTDGGAWTLTLPAGVDGQRFMITNCGSSGNDLTIDGNAAEEINGETTQLLSDGDSVIIIFETTEEWRAF